MRLQRLQDIMGLFDYGQWFKVEQNRQNGDGSRLDKWDAFYRDGDGQLSAV